MNIKHSCPFRTITVNEIKSFINGDVVTPFIKVAEQRFGKCQENCVAFLGLDASGKPICQQLKREQ